MPDLLPTSNSAEWHATLSCDLSCSACSRGSFLRQPHTAPMTIEDAHEFIRQARDLRWWPGIVITGGEPTLSSHFLELVRIACEFTREPADNPRPMAQSESRSARHVRIFSNRHTEKARRLCEEARDRYGASLVIETQKLAGTVRGPEDYPGWGLDTFVSPEDIGKPLRVPCYQHSSQICGVSVDHDGYSPCSPGGALGALLGVGKTKRLADLFEPEKMAAMTEALCRHCGSCAVQMGVLTQAEVDAQPKRFNTPMSKRWVAAFEGRR